MAGLVPAIHVLACQGKDVDARDKARAMTEGRSQPLAALDAEKSPAR